MHVLQLLQATAFDPNSFQEEMERLNGLLQDVDEEEHRALLRLMSQVSVPW